MWNLIFNSALTIFNVYNLHYRGNPNYDQKVFVPNTAEDNLLFDSGLILEASVSLRVQCTLLSLKHQGCNLFLFNPSQALCRLYHYEHANQTGTGLATPGWNNYARQCTGPHTVHDCNATDTPESCFYETAWKKNHACVFYKRYFTNTGGSTMTLNLDFDLEAGMYVVVQGPVPDITDWVGAYFYDADDYPSFGIDVDWYFDYCEVQCLRSDAQCNDPMPKVDLTWVTFTFRLTECTSEIFVDGRRVAQFPDLYRGNMMKVYGIGDVAQVLFIHNPDEP